LPACYRRHTAAVCGMLQTKERTRDLRVWEKTTASSRVGRTRQIDDSELPEAPINAAMLSRLNRGLVSAAASVISKEQFRREDEPMAEYLMKKREMFLVQMALDTKRDEIRKLEQKVQTKEGAIKKSELLLEEDAIHFDAFLKENDRLAHEALKNAEREAKAKTDKMQDIKKMKHAISLVEAEKAKTKETLDECKQYGRVGRRCRGCCCCRNSFCANVAGVLLLRVTAVLEELDTTRVDHRPP
jgi:hypothetical protein